MAQKLSSQALITKNDIEQVEVDLIGSRLKERVKTPAHPNYFKNLERGAQPNLPGGARKAYKRAMED